jgi:hypothetical protein
MKKLILLVVITICALQGFAQQTITREGNNFITTSTSTSKESKSKDTGFTYNGKKVYQGSRGGLYTLKDESKGHTKENKSYNIPKEVKDIIKKELKKGE